MPRWALLAAFVLGACDESAAPPSPAPRSRRGCEVDADCASGLRCAERACVGEAVPEYDLVVRVVPPADSPSGEVEVPGVRFDAGPVVAPAAPVHVPDEITVVRRVRTPDGRGVAGTVTARAEEVRGGRPLVASATTVATQDGPRFTLRLAPWWPTLYESFQCAAFTVRVVPDRDELPPWEQRGVRFGDCGQPGDVRLPANPPDGEVRCGGEPGGLHVVCGEVLVSRANPTPVSVQVFARDADGRAASTRATTDATGRFALALWPSAAPRDVLLRIEPQRPREQPLPRLDVSVALPPTAELDPTLVHRIYLGDTGRVFPARGRVVGLRGQGEEPLPAVSVRFRGTVGDGRFETRVETARDGTFTANVYPGDYVIDVDPGAADFRLLRTRAALAPDGEPARLTLRPRTLVTGRLVDPAGDPLGGATVEATLVRARYTDPRLEREGEAPPPRSDITTADADGRFTLKLDPGDHVLAVVAPPERGLPTLRVRRTIPGEQPVELGRLQVPSAGVVALSLHDDRDAPLAGARVEAWALLPEGGAVRVGEGLSGGDGRATLVVPAGPAPLSTAP